MVTTRCTVEQPLQRVNQIQGRPWPHACRKLYNWIEKQRQFRKAQKVGKSRHSSGTDVSRLTAQRIEKLDSIEGFWSCR
jgi:hypothetical protein